jgi:hypothetical protein
VGLPVVAAEGGVWRCLAVEQLSNVELRADIWRSGGHAPRGKPASMGSISTRTLNPETTRRKDSKAVAAAAGAPERCAMSRSNTDYAARGVRGDPRGRKSGAGPAVANPR